MQSPPRPLVSASLEQVFFWSALAASLACVTAMYWSSLSYEYVYDDRLLFLVDQKLRNGWESLRNISMPIISGSTYFRPAVLLSFVAEFSVFDGVPRVSRSVNLIIHLSNGVLVALLARRCAKMADSETNGAMAPQGISVLAAAMALIYGLHPSLIESAGWVSGRFDLMVTFFSLLGLLLAIRTDRPPQHWLVACCVLLALLSKEMAITLPLVILLFRAVALRLHPWQVREFLRTDKKLILAVTLSVAIYAVLRVLVHPNFVHVDHTVVTEVASPARFITLIATTLLFYVRLAIYPYRDTNPIHPIDLADSLSFSLTNGLAIGCLFLVLLLPVIAWRFRWPVLWLWCAALFAISPVLNMIPLRLGGNIGENRFLTFPLALAVCALSYSFVAVFRQIPLRQKLFSTVTAITALFVVAVNAAFVHATLPIWRSDITLFASCFAQYPGDLRVASSYLMSTMNTDNRSVALSRIEKQLAGRDVPVVLLTPYATALALEGRREEAIRFFEQAVAIKRADGIEDMSAVTRYAEVRQSWGERDLAEPMLARAKAIRDAKPAPGDDYLIAHLEMRQSVLLGDARRFESAIALLKTSVPPEMQTASLVAISTFRGGVCQRAGENIGNKMCDDKLWVKTIE